MSEQAIPEEVNQEQANIAPEMDERNVPTENNGENVSSENTEQDLNALSNGEKEDKQSSEEDENKVEDENNDDKAEEKTEEKTEEKKEKEVKEEKEVKDEKDEKDEKGEKKEKDEKEVKSESAQEKTKDVSSSSIPEKDEIPSELKYTCTKDHLILGNQVNTDVCDEIYDACTTQELLSIIVYFYSKDSPISIEYSINEEMNKEMISEQCATALINSKIFFDETVKIAPLDEIPDVEKVTQLTQDLPTEASEEHVIEPNLSPDPYAEFSEDDIEENEN